MAESQVSVRAKTDACDIPRSRRVLPAYGGTTPAVTESPRRRASKALEVLQLRAPLDSDLPLSARSIVGTVTTACSRPHPAARC